MIVDDYITVMMGILTIICFIINQYELESCELDWIDNCEPFKGISWYINGAPIFLANNGVITPPPPVRIFFLNQMVDSIHFIIRGLFPFNNTIE